MKILPNRNKFNPGHDVTKKKKKIKKGGWEKTKTERERELLAGRR